VALLDALEQATAGAGALPAQHAAALRRLLRTRAAMATALEAELDALGCAGDA
jgi:hypothetical protein